MLPEFELAKYLYEQRNETGDVTLIVESERIRAHRIVLAARSEKYKAQFYGSQPDQGDIYVNGVTAAAFEEFLKFFYLNEVDLSFEHIGDVLDLAKQSLVDDFVKKCIKFIKRKMTIDNLCSVYRLAMLYDIKEIKDLCEEKISKNTKALFATEDFANCDQETLMHILKLNSLNCSEGEVFDACIAWARADCDRKQVDASKPANLRAALGDTIAHIRFGSMVLEDIVIRYKTLEGFFTPEEYIEITQIIAKLDGISTQMFNRLYRTQTDGLLECNRESIHLQSPKENPGQELCVFQCNKPIRLHGFVLAADVDAPNEVFRLGTTTPREKLPIWIKKLANEIVVMFMEPFDVVPDTIHTFGYKLNDPKDRSFDQGFSFDEVRSNDTQFRFHCFSAFSLISRLLFTQN